MYVPQIYLEKMLCHNSTNFEVSEKMFLDSFLSKKNSVQNYKLQTVNSILFSENAIRILGMFH